MFRVPFKKGCTLFLKSQQINHNLPNNCKVQFTRVTSSSLLYSYDKFLSTYDAGGPGPPLTLPEKLVKSAPASWQPYLKLSRVDRPIGTWLLFWPSTWGLALGAAGVPPLPLISLFAAGAFVMRSAGCSINDIWDRNIDSKVIRTKLRPLASGEIRFKQAMTWTGAQLSVALAILISLQSPACFLLGIGSLGLVIIYPLAKRFTNWPQAILGLTFNTGLLMGFTAAGNSTGLFPWVDPACVSFYLAGNFWTLIYDTIYAHQDVKDDTLLGLGSTARKFGENSKYWLSGFAISMITCLITAGLLSELHWPFYACASVTSAHLFWQIKTLDIHKPANCGARFTSNRNIGWIILFGILGSYWVKKYSENNVSKSEIKTNLSSSSPSSLLSIKTQLHLLINNIIDSDTTNNDLKQLSVSVDEESTSHHNNQNQSSASTSSSSSSSSSINDSQNQNKLLLNVNYRDKKIKEILVGASNFSSNNIINYQSEPNFPSHSLPNKES